MKYDYLYEFYLCRKLYVQEPCPSHLRNSYFSHRCKYKVFPDGANLRDTGIYIVLLVTSK